MNNDTVGSISYDARINTRNLEKDGRKADGIVSGVADTGRKSFLKFGAAIGAVSGAVQSLFTRAIDSVSRSVGGAIKRVDTLNNSSRTFANMGFQADDTAKAMKNLERSITGLPTSLDEAVRGVQLLAGATGDVGRAEKIFSAVNNAVIGFGGTADQVSGAVRQLSQDLAGGRLQAETWNSLLDNGFGPTLNAIAKELKMTTRELKEGLSEGDVSVKKFTNRLIELNEKGGGGMASLEKIARDATSGIGTGMQNAQTAISRGLAEIIKAIGANNVSGAISSIGKGFEVSLKNIAALIGFIQRNGTVFGPIIVGLSTVLGLFTAYTLAVKIATLAQAAFNFVLAANPIGLTILALAGLTAALTYFFTKTEIGRKIFTKAFGAIKSVVMGVYGWIRNHWGALYSTLFGPIGGAAALIVKSFNLVFSTVMKIRSRIISAFRIVGGIAAAAIKSPINAVLGFAEGVINEFIRNINRIAGVLNKLPGPDIGHIQTLSVPRLAEGGVVQARPGGILANIGEGGQDEAVIPLDKLESITGGGGKTEITINLQGVMASSRTDLRNIAKDLVSSIDEEIKARGGKPILGAA